MNKRSNLKKQGYWKFIKLIKSYWGFKKEINIFLRPECNMTSFYNNISCNHKWSYSVNWWLLEKNLPSTFMLTPPQQFLQRSLAIIPQSNFWCDSGTVSEITGHTFSVETNFFLVTRKIPIHQWSVWIWWLFGNANLKTIYHLS